MASQADVAQVLVGVLAGLLYPAGTAGASVLGMPVRIFRGWPEPKMLQDDMRGGIVDISVYPTQNYQRLEPYPGWQSLPTAPVTLTATAIGDSVTIGGTVSVPCNIGITGGGHAWAYAVQPADSCASIAAALAAQIAADIPGATSSGAVVTVPGCAGLSAAAGGTGTQLREVGRQKRAFWIMVWAPDPLSRDIVADFVHPALLGLLRLALPDGTTALLAALDDGAPNDTVQKEQVYRSDLRYLVEYATTQTQAATQIVAPIATVTPVSITAAVLTASS